MSFFYRCTECDRRFEITPDLMVCPDCAGMQEKGTPLRGLLEVEIDVNGRTAYSPPFPWPGELLPVEAAHFPAIPVGNTPLWEPDRLRHDLDLPGLYLKDDTLNPTGSLKDRASVLVAAFARKHGTPTVTVASTGNAASSMAGIGAAAGLAVTIFVPENPPRAKLIQCLQYGAEVRKVDGPYDLAFQRSFDYVREHGGLNRNTGYNPLTIEGKKTAALEIFAQLGRMPDHIFVPVGDGVILCGIYKGLRDLVKLGFARTVPTVWAVQAEGSNAVSRAVAAGGFDALDGGGSLPAQTLADSISVGVPSAGRLAVKNIREHEGRCVQVSDDEILAAQRQLASRSGLFAEPAAAASLAGLLAAHDRIDPESTVVLLITGTGLKDIDSAERLVEVP